MGELALPANAAERRSPPAARALVAQRALAASSNRRTWSATRRCAPAATADGQPVPLALLGRAVWETMPATLRAEHGELSRLRLRRPRRRDRHRRLRRARAARRRGRRRLALQAAAGERLEWTGQYELLSGGPAPPADHRAARRAADAGAAVLPVPQPDRGADRARVGPVRAGRQLLDAVPARLPPVRARLGGPAVGGRAGDADRGGDGRLHRRRVPPPRARGNAAHAARTSSRPTPRARCSGCAPR